ncbi:MAG: hypothetical protein UT09_C0004G0010 [Parcubacteria group bacterium GW2011_GWF2_38_8]|nr:MAG: hypothetical protein UT09_C0004G0010 [Parcubacteria group bacterium GW2011_GWF2_38_8]
MIEVKDLLLRFSNILLSERAKKKAIADVLYEVVGIKIRPEDIKILKDAICLNIGFVHKNEIFLKKNEILLGLEKLNKKLPRRIT